MKLKDFIKKNNLKVHKFAEYCGISPSMLWHYTTETKTPCVRSAVKIIKATKGEVTLDDLNYTATGYRRIKKQEPEDVLGKLD